MEAPGEKEEEEKQQQFLWVQPTCTLPWASCRQCSANSKLVPPPGITLEQATLQSSATVRVGGETGQEGGVSWSLPHQPPNPGLQRVPPPPNPLPRSCVLGLLVTSPQGFQTREAARCSALASPGSRSSGTSAWNRLPMLMCLREQQGQAGSRGYPQGGGTPRDPTVPKYTQACRVSQDLPTQHSPLGHELRMQYFLGLHLGYSGMQGGWVIPQPGQQRLL